MSGRQTHYFLSTIGSKGQYSFIDSGFEPLEKRMFLYGYPTAVMQTIYQKAETVLQEKAIDFEVIHHCMDNSIEGLIVPKLQAGVFNFPLYQPMVNHVYHTFENEYLKLGNIQLKEAIKYFAKGLKVHDDWESIYISQMDFDKTEQLASDAIAKIIGDKYLDKEGKIVQRFFGAATINGPFDYIYNITEGVAKRYFIKGRPGTGKSTYLKKIMKSAVEKGFDVESYHCSFDPDSLDLIVIRELSLCLFDSTAPHEYFPTKESDEVVDIYQLAVKPDTDQKFAAQLEQISEQYRENIQSANRYLNLAYQSYQKVQNEISAKINPTLLENKIDEAVKVLTE